MRIIAGRWAGQVIQAPPGRTTRPITDRIKQSLFDWLGQDLSGVRMADVCSGSGAIAFEATSRGAREVHAIEVDAAALAILHANHRALRAASSVIIHARPFAMVLPTLRDLDLIIADPPFPWYRDDPQRISALLELSCASLRSDGSLLIRGDAECTIPACAGLNEEERRQWGRSWIAWLRRSP